MPRDKVYRVEQQFVPGKDYGIKILPKQVECLSVLKKGQTLTQKQFLDENKEKFSKESKKLYQRLVCVTFGTGEKIGVLKNIPPKSTPFEEFCKQETISYCIKQLRGSKFKNIKTNGSSFSYRKRSKDPS